MRARTVGEELCAVCSFEAAESSRDLAGGACEKRQSGRETARREGKWACVAGWDEVGCGQRDARMPAGNGAAHARPESGVQSPGLLLRFKVRISRRRPKKRERRRFCADVVL